MITFRELEHYKKELTKLKFELSDLRSKVGPDQDFIDLPFDIKDKISKALAEPRSKKTHANAVRRMLQQFIINEIYIPWRTLEGLPTHVGYAEGKLGITHKTGTGSIGQ
jgi:hypothetical protein